MPTPKAGESKDKYISRCISTLRHEGKEQDQAVAICYSMWEKKNEDVLARINRHLHEEGEATDGATTTDNVAKNYAKGHVKVIGGNNKCPDGYKYDKKTNTCVPVVKEEFKIQIKGITHDFMDLDKVFKDEKNRYASKKEAEKRMKRAIKAGRSAKSIRVVKSSEKSAPPMSLLKKESSIVGGSYVDGTTVNVIGSGQTRIGINYRDEGETGDNYITALKNKQADLVTRFNKLLGFYTVDEPKDNM